MIRKEVIDYLTKQTGIERRDLLEKDVLLHRILFELLLDMHFAHHYAFKGGTCLMKCHLGYYRFSEDLDFTWAQQSLLQKSSAKQLRKHISVEVERLAALLSTAALKIGMDFKPDKTNKDYFEFGGGNAQTTYKLWYVSQEQKIKSYIKIQINYNEHLEFPLREETAKHLLDEQIKEEFTFLFPQESVFLTKKISLKVYDIREILIEKARAILTRRGIKARDFVDIYHIQKHTKYNLKDFRQKIIDKTQHMLDYEKYKINLQEKKRTKITMPQGEENYLLLKKLGDDFPEFLKETEQFMNELLLSFK